MRESLLSFVRMPDADWHKQTLSKRRDLLLEACDLRSTFSPRVVRETLYKGESGELRSLCTGRDGRKLWDGPTRKSLNREPGESKFTYIRNQRGFPVWRSNRFSYLVSVLAEHKPVLKTVRPLLRLSVQFFKLDQKSFNGTLRAVIASLQTKIEVRHTAKNRRFKRFKPCLLPDKEIKSINPMVTVPLWDWRPVVRIGTPRREPQRV
jgi:hypothetical protein